MTLRVAVKEEPTDTEIFVFDGSTKGPSATVATTDVPHTYRIEMNTATGAIQVFRDNVSTLNGAAILEPAGIAVVRWGDTSTVTSGVVEWTSVTHNAHAFYPCP